MALLINDRETWVDTHLEEAFGSLHINTDGKVDYEDLQKVVKHLLEVIHNLSQFSGGII